MKISNIKQINKGKLLYTFNLEHEGIEVNEMKYIQGKEKFIATPSKKNFKGEWEPTLYMEQQLKNKVKIELEKMIQH